MMETTTPTEIPGTIQRAVSDAVAAIARLDVRSQYAVASMIRRAVHGVAIESGVSTQVLDRIDHEIGLLDAHLAVCSHPVAQA